MADDTDLRLEFAIEAARRAGEVTLEYFQSGVRADLKDDDSPVTVADRLAEERIREMVDRSFPGDGVIGEEFGRSEAKTGNYWIVDPIDGTKSFVQGIPLYGVLIAMENPDGIELGVVNLPALGELVWAARGAGCWWNGQRAAVSEVQSLGDACVCYTDWTSFAENGKGSAWERLGRSVKMLRSWGDCYGHVLVATGRADACFDPIMNPWDCGPLLPILQEAGGTFTDWQGQSTIYGGDAFSSNGHLFEAIAKCIEIEPS